jgi:hypothetical protein
MTRPRESKKERREVAYGQIQGDYEWQELWRQLYAYVASSLENFKHLIFVAQSVLSTLVWERKF